MNSQSFRKSFGFFLAVGLPLVLSQPAQASNEVILSEEEGAVCLTNTFEGGVHLDLIHPENGGVVPGTPTRFGPE